MVVLKLRTDPAGAAQIRAGPREEHPTGCLGGRFAPAAGLDPKACLGVYRGTSLIRKRTPLGPYRRPMPRGVLGGWAFSHGRGTPVAWDGK